jgi:NADH-quinone oxidoreductase subunit N
VSRQGEENQRIEDYSGLGLRRPVLGVVLTIFLLSLAGFPGPAGFMGKIYLLQGAVDAELWTLAVILVLATVLSYYYYLRVAWYAWMREPIRADQHDGIYVPGSTRLVLAAGVVVILLLGIFPSGILHLARASVEGMTSVGTEVLGVGP